MDKFEPIEGVTLKDLIAEESAAILDERKENAAVVVRKMLLKSHFLAKDIESTEKMLEGKRKKYEEILEIIKKARAGDWSVLARYAQPEQKVEEKKINKPQTSDKKEIDGF